ncbi:MAG: tetratricopeptide repeat protein, partial [Planctomycetes bacterium]|nr:tetratricopeptide repeat protein [Planctomycetota bacterium]
NKKLLPSPLYVAHSAYLGVESSPSLFYVGGVFAHHFGGMALALLFLVLGVRGLFAGRGGTIVFGGLAVVGLIGSLVSALVLAELHNTRSTRWLLDTHIVLSVAAVAFALLALVAHARSGSVFGRRALRLLSLGVAGAIIMAVVLPAAGLVRGPGRNRIQNPSRPPFEMASEAMGGASGPFFPSSAATSTGGRVPSDFFMTSETCQRCHADVYEQWKSSAHHFSSFNNQWYRKSIEYQQSLGAVQQSKWCAGCHDHAVLFNGMMDDTVDSFLHTQEAHTGLGCNSCHTINGVGSTMGNGDFYIEYPPLHDLAVSDSPFLRWLHDYAVRLDPEPHRQVFLKPFHREQTAEFCSACHKVHLDEPVNSYRWIRGFNEYDNWQASGVSGQGARSFYYPSSPKNCADCHMPLVESDDKGNIDGEVHDHAFVAANTALPTANLDEHHLRRTIEFLQNGQVTIDLFAAGPVQHRTEVETPSGLRDDTPQLSSSFAVGEESGMSVGRGGGGAHELLEVWAPLERSEVVVRRGEETRIDVVVRTRNVGHFFPGGTVDAYDVWLELKATDDRGQTIYWNGVVHDGGAGPVDEGAHFYGSHMVDAHGNPINKRNAHATRAVAWVNLIPPGAADVAHFRLTIPENCGDTIQLEARLNYRKFSHYNTGFAFAGRPAPGEPTTAGPETADRVTVHFDDREFENGPVPEDASAAVREIPSLPIVVMSRDTATLRVVDADAPVENRCAQPQPIDRERWNDYGIGLLRQGDILAAERAFTRVTEIEPGYADGWVNIARAALFEGRLDDAGAALARSLEIDPDLAKSHYFLGVALKEQGQYDEALVSMRRASEQYPRDRVVLNGIARVLFLKRAFQEAVDTLERVLAIDPEDLMAHYNLMLCYRGLGMKERADEERRLYERFKADEDAEMILGPYLRDHPEENRMRQPIHEQVSASAERIAREERLRGDNGDPHVVLPGGAADYARRVRERGERRIEAGQGAKRHEGPIEAGVVRPVGSHGVK